MRHTQLDLAGHYANDFDTQGLHHSLARKACSYALLEIGVLWLKRHALSEVGSLAERAHIGSGVPRLSSSHMNHMLISSFETIKSRRGEEP